ncbi:GIN domain-containing protein [Allosphingosinicella humi]
MKSILLVLAALAAAGPASAAERRITVTDYDRVQVEGPFTVTLATGKPNGAVVTGDGAALDRVSIDVQGRTLRVRANRSTWGGYPGEDPGPVTIALATHDLIGASVTGSGSLAIDKARAMRFELGVSGSGRIRLDSVETDILILGLLGSGRISIGGKTKSLRATIQGTGDLDAGALTAQDANIQSDTSGTVTLAAANSAAIVATGPGDVTVTGNPSCTVKMQGSGRVSCGR